MRSINVSLQVWQAIADKGKFGESEDDVLRRVFGLPALTETRAAPSPSNSSEGRALASVRSNPGQRQSFATNRMSSYISGNELRVAFASGPSNSWKLPSKSDKEGIRAVRNKAIDFAIKHVATVGQQNAVRKTLTEAGYHLTK